LPPETSGLPEAVPASKTLSTGGIQGANSWRRIGYGGPCPPSGTHRYFFKVYALDNTLPLASNATAKDVQSAMRGHILAEAQLMGRYKR
jgi:Raf kinase inhibitor-like YbhB/YbcL family protein